MRGADRWEWPGSLDAVAAAPGHHSLVLENDSVRVLVATVQPGDVVPLHTHRWPGVQYLVGVADFVRRDGFVVGGMKSVDQVMHERMAARPFMELARFDVVRYVDFGQTHYSYWTRDLSRR